MSIKLPVIVEYNGKGAKQAQGDLASLAKSYARNALSATALVEIARKSIIAANQDAASQRQLALALRNTAGANDYAVAKSEKFINSLQFAVGVADDELRPALATLANVTHDAGKAQELLQTALDLSAARGIDLQTAALGLSKAYQGNIGALRRMGVAVSDTAIKNKDFNKALLEITMSTKGAAAEAAKGADGGWKKLSVIIGDLAERVGTNLNNNLSDSVDILNKLGIATGKADDKNKLLNKALGWTNDLMKITLPGWRTLNDLLKDNTKEADAFTTALQSRNNTALAMQGELIRKVEKEAAARQKAKEKAKEAAKAAKEAADKFQESAKNALQAVQADVRAYVKSIGDAISANVSLSDSWTAAVNQNKDAADALKAATDERIDAYAELNMAQQTNDVEAYNKALGRVAKAEQAVTDAKQKQTTSYTEQFRNQVAAAKEFAGNLQKLIAPPYNLSQAGVSQLLDLGAVAGNQVAKDLLTGTAGLTVGEVNQSLADVQAAGEAAGMATPGYGAILGANVGRTGNKVYITVNTGVGDKNAISKQIVELLQDYDRTMGGVPIRTS